MASSPITKTNAPPCLQAYGRAKHPVPAQVLAKLRTVSVSLARPRADDDDDSDSGAGDEPVDDCC